MKAVSNVRPCIHTCTYAHAYVRMSTKSFFDFHEIWHVDIVGKGR